MVITSPLRLVPLVALCACSTANDYYQQIEIVGGPARLVAAEARDASGGVVLADLSAVYSGMMEVSSDHGIHGAVTVRGVSNGVYGETKEQENGLVFLVNFPAPYDFRVRTDPGDLYHYFLVGIITQNGDVTGDGVNEQYRLYLYFDKTPQ